MLFLIWLVLCVVVAFLIALPAAIWGREILRRSSGARLVTCPENQHPAAVDLDSRYAAASGMHGLPKLRVCDCTRWPERAACGQGCVAEAAEAEPYTPAAPPGGKAIRHLPVLLAAFAAWCLGAFWHAQYFLRPQWAQAAGLSRGEVKQMVWWISPHLLTAAAWLLFAYGVAWLLAVAHRRGVLYGVLMALLLGGALAAASSYGLTRLPRELLAVELSYAAVAVLLVGAVVGGFAGRTGRRAAS